jgi:hypothetical protein
VLEGCGKYWRGCEMIKEVTAFKIVCDDCGEEFCDETSILSRNPICADIDFLLAMAEECDWQTVQDSHYCPNCHKKFKIKTEALEDIDHRVEKKTDD